MASLSDLGKANFVLFLKTWLTIEEICFVDTAFCNKVQRLRFLSFLSSKTYSLPGLKVVPARMSNYPVWLKSRSIYVNRITLHNNFFNYLKSTLKFDKLIQLSFSRCWDDNRDNLVKVLTKSCNLTSIILTDSKAVTDSVINVLANTCTQLAHVAFINLILITNASLVPLFTTNRSIKSVDISGCISVADDAVVCLASNCRNLTSLNMANCRQISDVSNNELSKCQSGLTELDIAGCTLVSSASLGKLLENNTRLAYLNIDGVSFGIETVINILAAKCQLLTSLHIIGSIVNIQSIRHLGRGCPNLQELYCSNGKLPYQYRDESYVFTSDITASMPHLRHIELASTDTTWDNAFTRNVALLHILEGRFLQFSRIDLRCGNLIATRFVPDGTCTAESLTTESCDTRVATHELKLEFVEAVDWLNQILWSSADTLTSFSCETHLVKNDSAKSKCEYTQLLVDQCTSLTVLQLPRRVPREFVLLSDVFNITHELVDLQSVSDANCHHHLRELDLTSHKYEGFNSQLNRILTGNTTITKLNLAHCESVDDTCMYILAKHCHGMRDLDLSHTQVSDDGVSRIALGCKALQRLVVNSCVGVSYKSLEKVIQNCLLLESIQAMDVLLPMTFKQMLQYKYS